MENVPVFQSSAFKLKYHFFFQPKQYIFKIIHFDLYYLIIFLGNIYIKGNRRLPWSMATKTLPECKSYIMLNLPIYLAFMDESYHFFSKSTVSWLEYC